MVESDVFEIDGWLKVMRLKSRIESKVWLKAMRLIEESCELFKIGSLSMYKVLVISCWDLKFKEFNS